MIMNIMKITELQRELNKENINITKEFEKLSEGWLLNFHFFDSGVNANTTASIWKSNNSCEIDEHIKYEFGNKGAKLISRGKYKYEVLDEIEKNLIIALKCIKVEPKININI